jgi:hypothetical protein
MQLAKKSINKLSEVIGIKSVLTAMNLESDSEPEEVTIEAETQTEKVVVYNKDLQTDEEFKEKVPQAKELSTPSKKQSEKTQS